MGVSKTRSPISKFRTSVFMIIAILRMQKGAKEFSGNGIIRYVQKATKTKSKIDNLSEYLDTLVKNSAECSGKIEKIITQNQNIYKWNNLCNYLKINLTSNRDLNRYIRKYEG